MRKAWCKRNINFFPSTAKQLHHRDIRLGPTTSTLRVRVSVLGMRTRFPGRRSADDGHRRPIEADIFRSARAQNGEHVPSPDLTECAYIKPVFRLSSCTFTSSTFYFPTNPVEDYFINVCRTENRMGKSHNIHDYRNVCSKESEFLKLPTFLC